MKPECITVLMSTYNGERYLAEQIDSILVQADVDVKLCIRDDGSRDGTVALLDNYARNDARVFLTKGENLGVVASFFVLLREYGSDAELFAFADQDDIWHPTKLAQLAAALESASDHLPALSYCHFRLVDEAGQQLKRQPKPPNVQQFQYALVANEVPGCVMMINAALVRLALARLPDLRTIAMHDWWLMMIATALGEVFPVKGRLVDYRQHQANVIGMRTGLPAAYARVRRVLRSTGCRLTTQVESFRQCFSDLIGPSMNSAITAFLRAAQGDLLTRISVAVAPPFRRRKRIDDLALRALILAHHYRLK